MKRFPILLFLSLLTLCSFSRASVDYDMNQVNTRFSDFNETLMKAFLESFCCKSYEDCFPERQYIKKSLKITSMKTNKAKTKYEVQGTHSYKGRPLLGIRKTYDNVRFKAFVRPQRQFVKVEFHKWYVTDIPGKDGHWEISTEYVPKDGKPKIGLVLGGGGAKGAAAIGALKVIVEAGIKPHYIVGTSIGAVIGGLYAAGYSVSEIESLFKNNDWLQFITDGGDNDSKDRNVLGITKGKVVQQKLDNLLAKKQCQTFKNLRIPFKCIATDALRIKEVVLGNDSVSKAIRASLSIPGIYTPVKIGDLQLIDGGVMNNLPVDVVRRMGANIVIAIDLEQKGNSLLNKIGTNGRKREANIKDADIYLHPDLSGFDISSFGKNNFQLMQEIGEETARKEWNKIIKIKSKIR